MFNSALVLRLHFVCTSSEIQPLYSQQPLMLLPLYSIPPFALATTEDNGVGASTVIAEETQTTSEIMQSSYQTAVLSSEVQRKVSFKECSSDIRGVGTGPPLFFKASGLLLMGAEMFVRANLVDVLANEVPADVMRGGGGAAGQPKKGALVQGPRRQTSTAAKKRRGGPRSETANFHGKLPRQPKKGAVVQGPRSKRRWSKRDGGGAKAHSGSGDSSAAAGGAKAHSAAAVE